MTNYSLNQLATVNLHAKTLQGYIGGISPKKNSIDNLKRLKIYPADKSWFGHVIVVVAGKKLYPDEIEESLIS